MTYYTEYQLNILPSTSKHYEVYMDWKYIIHSAEFHLDHPG